MVDDWMTNFLTHGELSVGLFRQRRIPEAAREFRLSALAGEDQDSGALERWLTFMMAGEFEDAWRESDRVLARRRESRETCGHLPEHQRWLWDGTSPAGKHVLVRCFHGLGDTLQFARFLPQLKAVCAKVSFLPQAELNELIPPVLESGAPDLEMELMELPHALRTTLQSLPRDVPYLRVEAERARVGPGFRVGLAWASGAWRPERSVPLEMFRFLNDVPGLELTGLQRGPATLQLPPQGPVFRHADWRNVSVAQTARTIRGLDLVITTDTMVAHLAGALGAQVWTLLHWDADWRWMVDRDDSPWYPTMRLFRQREAGNWDQVLTNVQRDLHNQAEQIVQKQARAHGDADRAQAP